MLTSVHVTPVGKSLNMKDLKQRQLLLTALHISTKAGYIFKNRYSHCELLKLSGNIKSSVNDC